MPRSSWKLALVVGVGALALAPLASPRCARADSLKTKALKRTEDWLIVRGSACRNLKGSTKDKLRLYAYLGGVMQPIPYQIDERTKDGGYCFDQGPADKRVKKPRLAGLFDDDDELVFMARDSGDLAPEQAYPADQSGVEVLELKDPRSDELAWVYLFRFSAPPERSKKRYVNLEVKSDGTTIWTGDRYVFDNAKCKTNACRLTSLKYAAPGDAEPDYSKAVNVLDCTKMTGALKKTFVTFHKDSTDADIRVGGYLNGPVRVVAQNLVELYLALGIWISAPDSLLFLYPSCSTAPTNVKLPVDLSDTAGASWYKLMIDLSTRAKGWQFYNEKNKTPVPIEGKMSPAKERLDKTLPKWNCAFGPEGAIIQKFVADKKFSGKNELYFHDNLNEEEPPEFEPGAFGSFGFKIDLSGLQSGLYSGDYIIWYPPAPFKPGDEQKYLDILDNPVVVTAR
ncbi:hypothetical protein HY251_10655 [bacterium]|nr:hypothetical protein [bacterium]